MCKKHAENQKILSPNNFIGQSRKVSLTVKVEILLRNSRLGCSVWLGDLWLFS